MQSQPQNARKSQVQWIFPFLRRAASLRSDRSKYLEFLAKMDLQLLDHKDAVIQSRSWEWNIPDLDVYYTACVIGGSGAFVVPVLDWSEFEDAVRRKLVLEIAGQPARIWKAQARAPYNCLIGEEIWQRNRDIFALP